MGSQACKPWVGIVGMQRAGLVAMGKVGDRMSSCRQGKYLPSLHKTSTDLR